MSLTHLLFPIASAAEGKEGLQSVIQVAKALTAKLTLLRVVDPFRDGGPRPAREEAASLGTALFGLADQQVHVQGHSDMAAGIMKFASAEKVDAIVLPPKKRNWIEGNFGNEDLVRKLACGSPCPIWLTKSQQNEEAEEPMNVRRILCAVSGRDLKVLETAALLSEQFAAELFVLHVIPEIHEGLLAYGFDEHIALSAKNGMELLANMQRRCGTHGQPLVEIGAKAKCISRAARSLRADLVVTGRQDSGEEGLFAKLRQAIAPVTPKVACQTLMV